VRPDPAASDARHLPDRDDVIDDVIARDSYDVAAARHRHAALHRGIDTADHCSSTVTRTPHSIGRLYDLDSSKAMATGVSKLLKIEILHTPNIGYLLPACPSHNTICVKPKPTTFPSRVQHLVKIGKELRT